MKILLSAPPATGKSTVIDAVVKHFAPKCKGIVAREILDDAGKRTGFTSVNELGQSKQFMSRAANPDADCVGYFAVDVSAIDDFVVPQLNSALHHDRHGLIYVDEIGRAQMKSPAFMSVTRSILDSDHNVLASIVYKDEPESMEFKQHPAVCILQITKQNRDAVPQILISAFENSTSFAALRPEKQAKIYKLLKQFIGEGNFISAQKIFTNALTYVLETRIQFEGEEGTTSKYQVKGISRDHQIAWNRETQSFVCDCDLSNGLNLYAGLKQPCSHEISILLAR